MSTWDRTFFSCPCAVYNDGYRSLNQAAITGMTRHTLFLLFAIGIALAACTLTQDAPLQTPAAPAVTFSPSMSPTPAAVPTATLLPALESNTGAYADVTPWLDGVCFAYLARLNGTSWVWTSQSDLDTFYNRVDESGLCERAAARPNYDFNAGAVAGVVSVRAGCDAAYIVTGLIQDDATHTQTLTLSLQLRPGCPYDLIEPLLIIIPPLPAGTELNIVVNEP